MVFLNIPQKLLTLKRKKPILFLEDMPSSSFHCKLFSSSLQHRGNWLTRMLRHTASSEHLQCMRNFSFSHPFLFLLFDSSFNLHLRPQCGTRRRSKQEKCAQKEHNRGKDDERRAQWRIWGYKCSWCAPGMWQITGGNSSKSLPFHEDWWENEDWYLEN